MAFDERLAAEVRSHLERIRGVAEKRMFGGVAFLINGNMSVGILKNELIVRLGPEKTAAALQEPGARAFDITGRPMKGWVMVRAAGLRSPASLGAWIDRGVAYAASLPRKTRQAGHASSGRTAR